MPQKFCSKRALLVNILSILACCALLAGTTLAWFIDTVTSSGNRIVAGNLKVDLLMRGENGEYDSIANGEGDIFSGGDNANPTNYSLWEPGKTQVVYLAVRNLGTLALRYNILLDIEDGGLANALEFVVVNGDESSVVESWESVAGQAQNLGTLLAIQGNRITAAPYGRLDEEGDTDYFALVVHMREDAGNQFQDKDVIIDVTVVATQASVESDSFDNQYDAGASFPVTTSEDLANAIASAKPGDIIHLAPGVFDIPDINVEGLSLIGAVDEYGNPASTVMLYQDSNGDIDTLKITKNNVNISNIYFHVSEDSDKNTSIIYASSQNITIDNCVFMAAGTEYNCIHLVGSGKISNCTFSGGSRQIGWGEAEGTVIIENCTFEGADYGIHFDGGTSNVIIRNCVIASKNSFAKTLNNVVFNNCYFKDGGSSNVISAYTDITATNCKFDPGFGFNVGQSGITLTATGNTLLSGKTFKKTVEDSMAGKSYFLTLIENGATYNLNY